MGTRIQTPCGELYIYSFDLIDSRCYMLKEKDRLLIIDPGIHEDLLADAGDLKKAEVFLTHEHYDHIWGVNWLREHLDCTVHAGSVCADYICNEKKNATRRFPLLFLQYPDKFKEVKETLEIPYTCEADESFLGEAVFTFTDHTLKAYETPGHSVGSCLYILDDQLLFSGDSLLGNGNEMRFWTSSVEDYRACVLGLTKSLDPDMTVCPGHGEPDRLGWFLDHIQFPNEKKIEGLRPLLFR